MLTVLLLLTGVLNWPAQVVGCDHYYFVGANVVASEQPLTLEQLISVTSSIADIEKYYTKYSGLPRKDSVSICITDMDRVVKTLHKGPYKKLLGYYVEAYGWAFVGPESLKKCNTDLAHELVHAHSVWLVDVVESERLAYGFEAFLLKEKGCK